MEAEDTRSSLPKSYSFISSLIAGGVAGLVVDVCLFPIDTLKTRLQSERGFWKSGGFHGVYRGIGPAATGSAPTSALFFCVYEGCKFYFGRNVPEHQAPFIHMLSASIAEISACLIRVPVEIAKQRKQALNFNANMSSYRILMTAYQTEGICNGLYRGYGTTVLREIPFSFIQFPLWEYFKLHWTGFTGTPLTPWSVAMCGALAGGISAAITTPLDVAKTRIMLANSSTNLSMKRIFKQIYREQGVRGLFAGIVPRVVWITLGGAIFFGSYDLSLVLLNKGNR